MDQFIQAYEACKQNQAVNESLIKALDEASIKTLIEVCETNNYDVSLASLKPPAPKPENSNITLKDILGEDLGACFGKACKWDDLEYVKYFIEQGADVHWRDDIAVRWASGSGHLNVVKYLVEQGADIHAENNMALRWAAEKGHLDVVKYLVEQGAVINDVVVRYAASNYQFKTMKYLMENYISEETNSLN